MTHGGPMRRQQGVALVVVLWLGALLAVVASSLATGVRTDTLVARNRIDALHARNLAEAGLVRSLLELESPLGEAWRKGEQSLREFDLPGGRVRALLRPSSGLLNINRAAPSMLIDLFAVLGVEQERRELLVDAILDWRDGDDLRRLKGAEASDYRRADLDYGPRDGPFQHLFEVRQVLGMDGELFQRLRPHLTLWSVVAQPDQRYATRPLLLALMNNDEERVDDYLRVREDLPGADLGGPWHLRVEATPGGGGQASLEVVLALAADGRWQVRNWYNSWRTQDDG